METWRTAVFVFSHVFHAHTFDPERVIHTKCYTKIVPQLYTSTSYSSMSHISIAFLF
jgi:hypothetical protein